MAIDNKPAVSIKDMLKRESILSSGHRMCAGCGAPTVIKLMGMALRGPTIICNNTGCLEVATTIYPYTAWKIPWIHVAFENAAAVASGVIEATRTCRCDCDWWRWFFIRYRSRTDQWCDGTRS
jgi:pyruvate ferredoxin oxidoreductase beta subunit